MEQWIVRCLGACVRFQAWRESNKRWSEWLLRLLVLALSSLLLHYLSPVFQEPSWWPSAKFLNWQITLRSTISFSAGALLMVVLPAIMSVLAYLPPMFANRDLGFVEVSLQGERTSALMKQYLSKVEGRGKRIKIVCVTGESLFMIPDSPFKAEVDNGMVDVIMPVSDPVNPTVRRLTEVTAFNTPEQVVAKMQAAKHYLQNVATTNRNNVFEHKQFCTWRIVLLENYCIVSSYYPDQIKGGVWESPHYVFQRRPGIKNSYYAIFEGMVDAFMTKCGTAIVPPSSSAPPANHGPVPSLGQQIEA